MDDRRPANGKTPESRFGAWLRAHADKELIERLRAGDEQGAEELVYRYAGRVYRLALKLTGSHEDAEEVTWEVMLTVWRKVSSFRGGAALSTWIYRIATNAVLGKLRTRTSSVLPLEDVLSDLAGAAAWVGVPRDWSAYCEDPAVRLELLAVLERAILELPSECRAAVVLHDMEGLSNQEVADILGLSLPAVKSRVHRARLALRRSLAQYFAGETGTEVAGPAKAHSQAREHRWT